MDKMVVSHLMSEYMLIELFL